MANTSLTLGEHWETFIKNKIASGRYGSASEVVRDALRHMEEQEKQITGLAGTSGRRRTADSQRRRH